jgi:hypothetical protein
LWTPGGEHEVPRDRQPTTPSAGEAPGRPQSLDDFDLDDLTPEQQAEAQAMMAEMAEVQQRIAEAPAADVLANHLMGFYELGAIHLSQQPPHFAEAAVAIDALRIVLDGMEGRLGENEPTLRQALTQIQMAFVQLKDRETGEPA